MSIDLNSLLESGQGSTLQDFVSAPALTDLPINNEVTGNNLAAHAALLTSPEEAVDTYSTIKGELAGNDGSPTMDEVLTQANERENNLSAQAMGDILGDPSIPLDQKVGYASLWRTGVVQPVRERSPEELVQTNQLEKEGAVTDNEEVDATRWNLAGKLQEVNDYNAHIQKRINEIQLSNNPNIATKLKELGEMIIPLSGVPDVDNVRKGLNDITGGDMTRGVAKTFTLFGESKEEIRNNIAKLPLAQRQQVADKLIDLIVSSNASMTGGKNSMRLMMNLREYLVDGEYGTGDRVVDDITGVLDLIGVGSALKVVAKGGKLAKVAEGMKAAESEAKAAAITNRVPVSAGETVAQTNTKSANDLFKMADKDKSGEVAKTVYSSDRDSAITNVLGPEIGNDAGKVRHKPLIDDEQFDPDFDVIDQIVSPNGSIQYTDAEKLSKLSQVAKDFQNVEQTGLVNRKEMTSIQATDDGVNVRTIYAPADGAFSDPVEAGNQVKQALRKYGVDDGEVTILRQDGSGGYTPVKDAELEYAKDQALGKPGTYVVGINHTTPYDPTDTIAWSVTDVKGSFLGIPLNIFDKFPSFLKGKGGSITQHLIPPSSYISPTLTRAASVTADKSAHSMNLLVDLGNEWATSYKSLPAHQRKIIDNYILEANHKSLKFDPASLRAQGWTPEMLTAMRKWKKTNDTLYVLENTDLVRQSKRKGFQMFTTSDGKDQWLVKPISNPTAGNMKVTKVYDPVSGEIRSITSQERSELYKRGGTIAIGRTPFQVGDETIAYVKVDQNGHNYTRALRESDQLLSYRDGHFTIYYKNPIFIEKAAKNADKTTYQKAVATAGTLKDAEAYVARLRKADPKGNYTVRGDRVGQELEEMMWNQRVNSGRTAQRARGKMLADVTDRPTDLGFRHIATPEESLLRSINSISRRINYKEYLDVAKKRYMEQYKAYLPVDPKTHVPYWPEDVTQLVKPKSLEADISDFSDAKSTFRYIDQMENGFINLLDDASKNFFKTMADTAGKKGWQWAEKGARAGENVNATAFLRKKAFRFLLAANPIRQYVVQASQAMPVILATNPTFSVKLPWQLIFTRYLDRGGDVSSFYKMVGHSLSGLSESEAKALEKAYRDSGISSAVSAHSLIRDDLRGLVNRGVYQKAKAVIGKPIDVMQKVGFEAGENLLMRSVWLSEYDNLKKTKKTITAADLANLHARVRDLTLNMNKAGELAYNENMLSPFMQFAQAPHKAFAQIMIGNRSLSKADRIKLGTAYVATYGTGYGIMYEQASKLLPDDDRDLHDIVSGGLFNLAMNRVLGTLYGEEVNTDFSSSMRLLQIPHLGDVWTAMATMDPAQFISSSPSLSLVVGDNARVGNLFRSMARFYTVPEDDGNLKDVGVNFLSIFSGASNIFKARFAMARGFSRSTKGEVNDPSVNEVEAMMMALGFNTVDEMLKYQVDEDLYFNSKAFRDDVKYLMDETTRRLGREGISEVESEYVLRMYREANRVYADNPAAMQVVQSEISRRLKSGDSVILNRLIEQIPMVTESEFRQAIAKAPLDEEQKKQLINIYNTMKEPE